MTSVGCGGLQASSRRARAVRIVACAVAAVTLAGCPGPAEQVGTSGPRPGPNGEGDLAYGVDGLVLFDVAGRSHDVHDALPLAGGALAVLGRSHGEPGPRGFVLRLEPDGRPAAGFGDGGVVEVGGWTPDRLVLAEDGTTTVVGGTQDDVAVARFDADGARSSDTLLAEVPVPQGHVAVGVQVDDAVADQEGLLVAGRVQVNREEDVGGCCAIEPDNVSFRLRLGADGTVDESHGPGGFQLGDVEEGETGEPILLPGTSPRAWRPELPAEAPAGLDAIVSVALDDGRHAWVGTFWTEGADESSETWLAVWASS